jgi:hypothetical protein
VLGFARPFANLSIVYKNGELTTILPSQTGMFRLFFIQNLLKSTPVGLLQEGIIIKLEVVLPLAQM